MIDHINVLKTSWYLSPPWGKTIPPVEVNLLERVFLRTTRTFGYCSGVQWKHECWLYTVICGDEIVHATEHQIIGTGQLETPTSQKPASQILYRLKAVEVEQDRVNTPCGHKYSVVGFANLQGLEISVKIASAKGRKASASVSLGSCRKFQIKPIGGRPTDFWLEHGSLLVMHPGCQSTHLHQVPKTNKVVSTRINLTFRPHTGGK